MPIRIKKLTIPVSKTPETTLLENEICHRYGLKKSDILDLEIIKKSLDARRKSRIVHHYQLRIKTEADQAVARKHHDLEYIPEASDPKPTTPDPISTPLRHPPLIVGTGPAGIFAGLTLAARGVNPILVDRGEAVEKRFRTVNRLRRQGLLDPESNYCYGEGGAGTFSDGKLTCGRNHPLIRHIFQTFVQHGAPKEILYEAHPHMGTDYLLRIALSMRQCLKRAGATFHFGERMTSFRPGGAHAKYLVRFASGLEIPTDHLILAIGHSARDTYQSLFASGLAMEQKPFAIGARIEHPQDVIDQIQFGSCSILPAAEYKLAAQVQDRGIWTFCMCPGGHLLPTSAADGLLAINGMSYHARSSGFANGAVVVNVRRQDYDRGHPLDGMWFQEALERKAFRAGGNAYHSPAQKLVDFLAGRTTKSEMQSSYRPGIVDARMDQILPDFVVSPLRTALVAYDKKMKGYLHEQAIIVGLESKTSAPVVMPRQKDFQSLSHPGIYPCGEGAGHAGGIISAALDGVRVGGALQA